MAGGLAGGSSSPCKGFRPLPAAHPARRAAGRGLSSVLGFCCARKKSASAQHRQLCDLHLQQGEDSARLLTGTLYMVGRVFMGRYEVLRLLGEGGMGRVYLARQLDLGRQVVVKVMHDHIAADPVFRDRFRREMQLMAHFQHPYVVTLYDASLNDPQGPCIVMEFIKGITLDTLLARNNRLSAPRAGRLLGQLC